MGHGNTGRAKIARGRLESIDPNDHEALRQAWQEELDRLLAGEGPYEYNPETGVEESIYTGRAGAPMSHEEALRRANPKWVDDQLAVDLGRMSFETAPYLQNCQRAIWAYELMRRGYDVTAQGAVFPWKADDVFQGKEAWGFGLGRGRSNGGSRVLTERIIGQMPEGARCAVQLELGKDDFHVFMAEKKGGRVRFFDPQLGDTDCSSYFDRALPRGWVYRMDNQRVSGNVRKAVIPRGAKGRSLEARRAKEVQIKYTISELDKRIKRAQRKKRS